MSSNGVSFRSAVRKRLLDDMFGTVRSKGTQWKVLVMDQKATEIVSACIRMHEIMDMGITLCEDLEVEKRKSIPDLDVIYFVSPTPMSLEAIAADFPKKGNCRYNNVHVFTTSALPDTLMEVLGREPLVSRMETLVEMNVEFLATEEKFFDLDYRPSQLLRKLYVDDGREVARFLHRLSEQLVTVCATLNEYPFIRYRGEGRLAEFLARKLQSRLDQFAAANATWKPRSPRSTLIIVDRAWDSLSPFLHEFTYQAMAFDLLTDCMERDGKYHWVHGGGDKEKVMLVTEDTDPLWVEMRHRHIAEVAQAVTAEFKDFMSSNSAAQFRSQSGGQQISLKNIAAAVSAMPEFQDKIQQYSLHIDIAKELMKRFQDQCLPQAGEVEQNLATGETATGSKMKSSQALKDVMEVLRNPQAPHMVKLRVLLVYVLTQGGVDDQVLQRLCDAAAFGYTEMSLVKNLRVLVGSGGESDTKTKSKKEKRKEKKKKNTGADDVPYDLSRYVPPLRSLIEQHLRGDLSKTEFPYIHEPPPTMEMPGSGAENVSLSLSLSGTKQEKKTEEDDSHGGKSYRSRRGQWKGRQTNPEMESVAAAAVATADLSLSAEGGGEREGPSGSRGGDKSGVNCPNRVLCFVIGGATYSELRSAYELADASVNSSATGAPSAVNSGAQKLPGGVDVCLGSTHVWRPEEFVKAMAELRGASTTALE